MPNSFIKKYINYSNYIRQSLDIEQIEYISEVIWECFARRGKLLVCGNGGSAADAEHLVAELVNKFSYMRKGLLAISLIPNTPTLTSICNDISYDMLFSRQIETYLGQNDIVLGLTTSGNSNNIINAFKTTKEVSTKLNYNCKTISLVGNNENKLKEFSDIQYSVSSDITPIIQESHMLICHIIALYIDYYFNESKFKESEIYKSIIK